MISIICKKIVFIFIILISTASSFTTRTNLNIVSSQKLSFVALQARVDSSDAVTKALEASKKFGAASKEARLAWEEVEEIASSDNSAAYSGGVNFQGYNDPNSEEFKEFDEKMSALGSLLEENKAKLYAIKSLAQEVQSIKISPPTTTASSNEEQNILPMIKELVAQAKVATDKFGADSNEAKLAWENVEEVSASNNSVATMPTLDEQCLTEALEACEALEELERVIALQKTS